MSMNAIAVLGIKWSRLLEALGEGEAPRRVEPPEGARWLQSLYGGSILVHQLDDGAMVDLGHDVGDLEPEELGGALRAHLGPLLDAHQDERGIFVFPAKARQAASTVEGVIEEVGELGEWVQAAEPAAAAGLGGGIEDMMGQMLGGMDPSQMQGLFQQAQQMMADPEMAEQMMAAAAQMMGGDQGGFDLSALAAQAKQLADEDPELIERLRKGMTLPDDDSEDGEDGEDGDEGNEG